MHPNKNPIIKPFHTHKFEVFGNSKISPRAKLAKEKKASSDLKRELSR
jgi:hypothetical protein